METVEAAYGRKKTGARTRVIFFSLQLRDVSHHIGMLQNQQAACIGPLRELVQIGEITGNGMFAQTLDHQLAAELAQLGRLRQSIVFGLGSTARAFYESAHAASITEWVFL